MYQKFSLKYIILLIKVAEVELVEARIKEVSGAETNFLRLGSKVEILFILPKLLWLLKKAFNEHGWPNKAT